MAFNTPMYAKLLNLLKGDNPDHNLDKMVGIDTTQKYNYYDSVAQTSTAQTAAVDAVKSGMVGYISGTASALNNQLIPMFKLGLPRITTDGLLPMPLFVWKSGDSYDVSSPTGNNSYSMVGYSAVDAAAVGNAQVAQRPVLLTYVATGGYEFETNEYDHTEGVLASYVPNMALSTYPPHASAGMPGTLAPVVVATRIAADQTVCGIVSDGLVGNQNYAPIAGSPKLLRFWSVFLPVFPSGTVTLPA